MCGLGASVSQLTGNSGMALARLDHRQKVALVSLTLFQFLYWSTYSGKSKLLYHGRGHTGRNSRQDSSPTPQSRVMKITHMGKLKASVHSQKTPSGWVLRLTKVQLPNQTKDNQTFSRESKEKQICSCKPLSLG